MKRIGIVMLAFFTCFALAAWPQAQPQIITFDAPGAGTGAGQGTYDFPVTPTGIILGYYVDANGVYHSYFRSPNNTFTTFDAPGAGTVKSCTGGSNPTLSAS
jgi:hypothetical protein